MTCNWKGIPAAFTIACCLAAAPARAQAPEATLRGVVRDESGAAMADAHVSASAAGAAARQPRTTTTGRDGAYALALQPG
jgi:F0F1-type ATP synthase membrane subunit c/vacuolar-type H+-ATPase subunit K